MHGTHSFRVRTLSLGQDGNFSEWVEFEVDDLSYIKYNWGIASTFIVIGIIVIITIVCKKTRICRSRQIHDIDFLLPDRRDSDQSSVVNSPNESSRPERKEIQPSQSSQSPTLKEQQPRAQTSEGIQMTVFKSNFSGSTLSLNQPSTSTDPRPTRLSTAIPVQEFTSHSPTDTSLMKRFLRSIQVTPRIDGSSQQLISFEMEQASIEDAQIEDTSIADTLLSESPATRGRVISESESENKYEFPVFRQ